jgi:Histone deacetylase domain
VNECLGLPAISGFARLCPINWWCYSYRRQRASQRYQQYCHLLGWWKVLVCHSSCFTFISLHKIRHHAQKSCASGFCYVADCILAILAIKRGMPLNSLSPATPVLRRPHIMYLDLDLHYSDAVSDAFYAPISSTSPQILVSTELDELNVYPNFRRH